MSANEAIVRVLSSALVKLIQATPFSKHVKPTDLLFSVSRRFDQSCANGILNLEQIYQDMTESTPIEKQDLQGIFLVFQSQEEDLGIQMQLPAELLLMPPARRKQLLDRMNRLIDRKMMQASSRGGSAKKGPAARTPVRQPSRATAAPAAGSRIGARSIMAGILVVLVGISVYLNVLRDKTPKLDMVELKDVDLGALGLSGTLHQKENIFVLKIARRDWDTMPRPLQRSRLNALVKHLLDRGLISLIVMEEKTETLAIAGPSDVFFLDKPVPVTKT